MPAPLETNALVKEYPLTRSLREVLRAPFRVNRRRALDGLSLTIRPGERVALVGPNGAGKTTLARIACGVVLPDGGAASVAGLPVGSGNAWKRHVGLARPDDPALHPRLDARECLRFHAALYGLAPAAVDESLERAGATPLAARRVQTLSGGERARVSLAKALSHAPSLLILDELSRVLDPGAAARLREMLVEYVRGGRAVLLVTHDLAEAALCDRVVVMQAGRVAADGPWSTVEAKAREVFSL